MNMSLNNLRKIQTTNVHAYHINGFLSKCWFCEYKLKWKTFSCKLIVFLFSSIQKLQKIWLPNTYCGNKMQNLHLKKIPIAHHINCITKLGWTNLSCKKLHTTVFRLIRVIQTVLFSVTFPDFRDAPIVCDSTPELASAAVSYTSFQIHTQQKVIWAVTGVVLTPRSNQTQVRASPIVVPTWINT